MGMSVRDFFAGIDPETCGRGMFTRDDRPFCPIAHAASKYAEVDYKSHNITDDIERILGVSAVALTKFWKEYDNLTLTPCDRTRTSAFQLALHAAELEEMEQMTKIKREPLNENS